MRFPPSPLNWNLIQKQKQKVGSVKKDEASLIGDTRGKKEGKAGRLLLCTDVSTSYHCLPL